MASMGCQPDMESGLKADHVLPVEMRIRENMRKWVSENVPFWDDLGYRDDHRHVHGTMIMRVSIGSNNNLMVASTTKQFY